MAPKDAEELNAMLGLALKHNGPSAIRFPRGKAETGLTAGGTAPCDIGGTAPFGIGEAEILSDGEDIAILAIGSTVLPALSASKRLGGAGISAMVVNMRFVKPLDMAAVIYAATKTGKIITVEDNALKGGFGSAVTECLAGADLLRDIKVKSLGLPDRFVEHGTQAELRRKYGIDEEGIYRAAVSLPHLSSHSRMSL